MLKKPAYYASYVYVFRFSPYAWQKAADPAKYQLNPYTRDGRFRKLIDNLAFGQGIGLNRNPPI